MTDTADSFIARSTIKAEDMDHRRKINFNIGRYNAVVPQGKQQFGELNLARERAKNIKWKALETLDKQLEEFEAIFTQRGGKVIWAEDAASALKEILAICKTRNCKTIVKSKSMVTEEIKLNDFLEEHGIESVETDLGEYIQQLDGEPPYHIVTPAMHKSKEDVAKLFYEKLHTKPNLTPSSLPWWRGKSCGENMYRPRSASQGRTLLSPTLGLLLSRKMKAMPASAVPSPKRTSSSPVLKK